MKKAQFFIEEFLSNIVPEKSEDIQKNKWQKVQDTLLFVKNIHEQWHSILLLTIKNRSVAEKLALDTYPTHTQDEILYTKVTNADETMLISLHANAIIVQIQNTYAGGIYADLSEELTKIKPIYYLH